MTRGEKHLAMQRLFFSRTLGIIVAAAVLSGSGAACAESPYAIRDPNVPKNLSPAARARQQRSTAIKKMKETRQFIIRAAEGKEAAADGNKKGAGNEKTK